MLEFECEEMEKQNLMRIVSEVLFAWRAINNEGQIGLRMNFIKVGDQSPGRILWWQFNLSLIKFLAKRSDLDHISSHPKKGRSNNSV